ncbi:glycosyltransferase [Prolixibacteraceae bacterium Z1-6]|uniref:Glycosyltransferase n=1 Tax=Draconibacterium aestuarii TaxID=2998507 RepID=A0A9X3FAT8_9BACT|nr:glycosyltransferase [Prolixibacteraceae bacterium Z1-6]
MKNVCFFNSTMFWGGGEKAHLEYAINFRNADYNVWVVCSSGSVLETKLKDNNLQYFDIKIGNLSFLNFQKKNVLIQFFKAKNIDTVFFNAPNDIKIGGPAAKIAGVRNRIYMRGLAVPVKNSITNRYLFGKILTHVVPNSYDTRKTFLTKLRPMFNENNVQMIYRGINFDDWDSKPVKKMNFKENNEIILGNVGRLEVQKGQKYLIELANILREQKVDFKIIIAGTGPLENELQKLVSLNNLEKQVKLVGFQSDVKSFLGGVDIFVFPSLWEGFGNAMVEAMAEQIVPVAFDRSSNPEIIETGENGFLIDFPNIELFAEKVLFLIQNPEKRKQMGISARESVIHKFSLQKVIRDWEELLV